MKALLNHATKPDRHAKLRRIAVLFAIALIAVGIVGPRWGRSESQSVAVGRDIVLVLDLSRSMLAEDMNSKEAPARWQAAVAGAKSLVNELRTRGGDRVGVVIYAARPFVLVPLTTDADHILAKLSELDGLHPPAEVRPDRDDTPSGTRIGAALATAVQTHDERFPGFQEIILLTDADDPARDEEWRTGITAARNAGIPVHVVGLGDPVHESFVLVNGEAIEGVGPDGVRSQVQTQLHEEIEKAIANETRGVYLPTHMAVPKLDEFFRNVISTNATREVDDDRRPQPRSQAGWFYAAASLLLLFAWWKPVRVLN